MGRRERLPHADVRHRGSCRLEGSGMSGALPFGEEELWKAWERVQENKGCAGADGVSVPQFAHRANRAIPALLHRAQSGAYRAFPLLKIVVEKRPASAK